MGHGASHFYGPLVQFAGAAAQVVVGIKINIHGNTRGRASLANLKLLQLHRALRVGLTLLRDDGAVQVHRSGQTSDASGCSIVTPVTCNAFEKISGIISTPTFKDFAVKNGVLLKAGSSAMERSSAARAPVSRDRLMLPTVTGRPSAAVSFSSIVGRN